MASTGDTPGVIAPPPLLFLGALAVGLALDFGLLRVPTGLPRAVRLGLGAVLAVSGAALAAGALGRFRRAGTAASRGGLPAPW